MISVIQQQGNSGLSPKLCRLVLAQVQLKHDVTGVTYCLHEVYFESSYMEYFEHLIKAEVLCKHERFCN